MTYASAFQQGLRDWTQAVHEDANVGGQHVNSRIRLCDMTSVLFQRSPVVLLTTSAVMGCRHEISNVNDADCWLIIDPQNCVPILHVPMSLCHFLSTPRHSNLCSSNAMIVLDFCWRQSSAQYSWLYFLASHTLCQSCKVFLQVTQMVDFRIETGYCVCMTNSTNVNTPQEAPRMHQCVLL